MVRYNVLILLVAFLNFKLIVSSIVTKEIFDNMMNELMKGVNDFKTSQNMSWVTWDSELMKIAETEAARLASINILEAPQFTINFNYFGSSYKIDGMLDNENGTFYGTEIDYTDNVVVSNITLIQDQEDLNEEDYASFRDMGYGVASSSNNTLYAVMLSYYEADENQNNESEGFQSEEQNQDQLQDEGDTQNLDPNQDQNEDEIQEQNQNQ